MFKQVKESWPRCIIVSLVFQTHTDGKNKYNVPVHPGYFVLLEILRYTVSVCTGTNYTYL